MATIIDFLPADVSAYVEAELRSGKYQSAEELVSIALRHQRDRDLKKAELNALLDEGLRDIEQGNVIEIRSEEDEKAFFEGIKQRGMERLRRERGQ